MRNGRQTIFQPNVMAVFDGGRFASDQHRILDNSIFDLEIMAYSSRHDKNESLTTIMQSYFHFVMVDVQKAKFQTIFIFSWCSLDHQGGPKMSMTFASSLALFEKNFGMGFVSISLYVRKSCTTFRWFGTSMAIFVFGTRFAQVTFSLLSPVSLFLSLSLSHSSDCCFVAAGCICCSCWCFAKKNTICPKHWPTIIGKRRWNLAQLVCWWNLCASTSPKHP